MLQALTFPSLPSLPSRTAIANALSSLYKRVSNFVFSRWGAALVALSIAVGIRFGVGAGAAVGALGLMLGSAVQRGEAPLQPSMLRSQPPLEENRFTSLLAQIDGATSETGKIDILQKMDVDFLIQQIPMKTSVPDRTDALLELLRLICIARPSLSLDSFSQALHYASAKGSNTTVDAVWGKKPDKFTLDTIFLAVRHAKTPVLGLRILRAFLNERPDAARPAKITVDYLFEYAHQNNDSELSSNLRQMGVSPETLQRCGIVLAPNPAPAPSPSSQL